MVQHGDEKIVLPKNAEQKAKQAENDVAVRRSVQKFFSVCESNQNVKSVDFRVPREPTKPVLPIPRNKFVALRDLPELQLPDLPKQRERPFYHERVIVVTAVLEKSRKQWQFLWNGQRISADIQEPDFFQRLARHEYEFGQGDTLVVDLLVYQELNEIIRAYENKRFHITKVHDHIKGPKQECLF